MVQVMYSDDIRPFPFSPCLTWKEMVGYARLGYAALIVSGDIFGHVPHEFSKIVYYFIK